MTHATPATTELLNLIERRTRLTQELADLQKNYAQAMQMIDERMTQLLQPTEVEQEQKPTVVEPEPELKVKSVAQEKAEANARIALANKGRSAKDKAEALDVPVATVRKVEKAKAAKVAPTSDKPMDTAAMKKLAKELGVSYEGIKFTSSKARDAFRATLEQAQAKHESKVWEGLSPSRQAKLSRTASVDPNRASARAIAI